MIAKLISAPNIRGTGLAQLLINLYCIIINLNKVNTPSKTRAIFDQCGTKTGAGSVAGSSFCHTEKG